MHLTKSTEQAICIMVMLYLQDRHVFLNSKEISQRLNISPTYLKKIMRKLVVNDLVKANTGIGGGYKYKSNKKDKEILIDIKKAIDSSIELRSKKELIEGFIDRVNSSKNVTDDFKKFVREEKEKDLEKVIEEEKLKPEETKKFIDNSLRDGTLKTTGTDIDKLLPPVSRFGGGNRVEKKLGVIGKLKGFFDKYLGLTI